MDIEILYEDNDVLAINKPAGLVVHSDGKTDEMNLVDWLISKYPEIKEVGEPTRLDARFRTQDSGRRKESPDIIHESKILNPESLEISRPGIVHRLDKETSGVMLIAKNQKSFENLKKQFQQHKIQKVYQAFLIGELKQDVGIIDRPIGRSPADFRRWSAQRGARGEMREAITEYKVLERKDGYSFVEVYPKTGRTHQIRVHFKAINYPLVCDSLYAPSRENSLGFERLALHSYQVTFAGVDGQTHTVLAPYPEDFDTAVKILKTS